MMDDNHDSDESNDNYYSVTMLIVNIFTMHQQAQIYVTQVTRTYVDPQARNGNRGHRSLPVKQNNMHRSDFTDRHNALNLRSIVPGPTC